MEDCIGGECASPQPTFDPYAVLPDPDDWPEPPDWMFTALYIVIAIMVAALIVTILVALATWRRRTVETRERQPKEWVALSDIPSTTRGGVRGVRESSPTSEGAEPPPDDVPADDLPPDDVPPDGEPSPDVNR